MKHVILYVFALLLSFSLKAQSTENIIEYFDKNWQTITNPKEASYYRTLAETNGRFIMRDYSVSGKIIMIASCSQVAPVTIFDGQMTIYYENGVIQEEGLLKNNSQAGLYKSYYQTGKPKIVMSYEKDKPKYIHYWSEEGLELLPNGKGIIPALPDPKGYQYSEIEDSVMIAGFSVAAGDTIYSILDQQPEYKGGYQGMMRKLSVLLKSPEGIRRMKFTGSVSVKFIVDEKGAVSDCKIHEGLRPDCDAAALDAVCKLDGWMPGIHHQKPVKTRFVLPITFKSDPSR